MRNEKLRIAIVGCGGMGSGHAMGIHSGTGNTIWSTHIDNVPPFPGEVTTEFCIETSWRLAGARPSKLSRRSMPCGYCG